MGLEQDLMSGVSGAPGAVAMYASIAASMEREQGAWIADLRAAGVKAAHPDDGWVNRKCNTVRFVYPQFNDGAKAGDLVALGWPAWLGKTQHRIVRLIGRDAFSCWRFEP
jgi:hypothetical protein